MDCWRDSMELTRIPEKVVGKSLVLEGPDAHPKEEDPAQQHQDVRDAHAPSVLGHNFKW